MSGAADPAVALKEAAARHAVGLVASGMSVGLGTGSTAAFAVRHLAERLRTGQLRDIVGLATSRATAAEARRLGIPLMSDDLPAELDLTIDGADEVDPQLDLIKGAGGALLREKIVAQASRRVIIVVDGSKPSPRLGSRRPVPVEVVGFGSASQMRYLADLGAACTLRLNRDGKPFLSDSGHLIIDCDFGPIADATQLADALERRAGVMGHGLFLGLATDLITATEAGVVHRVRPGRNPERTPEARP
ncbi:MAG: ribose-5-phosphate isomerase RpiA [Candidatus Krumholzibacteriia bacterium]